MVVVMYWIVLVYPWFYNIYTTVIKGTSSSHSYIPVTGMLILILATLDDLKNAQEAQIQCSASGGTDW